MQTRILQISTAPAVAADPNHEAENVAVQDDATEDGPTEDGYERSGTQKQPKVAAARVVGESNAKATVTLIIYAAYTMYTVTHITMH